MLVKPRLILGSLAVAAALSVSSAGAAPAGLAAGRHDPALEGRLVQEAYGGYPGHGRYAPPYRRPAYGFGYRFGYHGGYWRHHHWRPWYRYHDDRGWWRHRDYRRCMIEPWLCRRGY